MTSVPHQVSVWLRNLTVWNSPLYKNLLEKSSSPKTWQCDQKYDLRHRFSISTVYFTSKMTAINWSLIYLQGEIRTSSRPFSIVRVRSGPIWHHKGPTWASVKGTQGGAQAPPTFLTHMLGAPVGVEKGPHLQKRGFIVNYTKQMVLTEQ